MTGFKWSLRSKKEMYNIHPDLRRVCNLALKMSDIDFLIIDGRRTIAEQRMHVKNGASKTLRSRHLHGYAVDVAPLIEGKIRWEPAYFKPLGVVFKKAAIRARVPIVWGGDWKWKDWGHFELDKKVYPDP